MSLRAAAKQYNIPVELAASVAYRELGNDNASNDRLFLLAPKAAQYRKVLASRRMA